MQRRECSVLAFNTDEESYRFENLCSLESNTGRRTNLLLPRSARLLFLRSDRMLLLLLLLLLLRLAWPCQSSTLMLSWSFLDEGRDRCSIVFDHARLSSHSPSSVDRVVSTVEVSTAKRTNGTYIIIIIRPRNRIVTRALFPSRSTTLCSRSSLDDEISLVSQSTESSA